MAENSKLQGVADTAHWVAMYRAAESERRDAHFRDQYARRLAGLKGEQIMATLPRAMHNAGWSVVARTVMMDRIIERLIGEGITLVLNLAAGLDTRPYRLDLPSSLLWIEVDQDAIIAEKSALLADATPNCILERISLDLRLEKERREQFMKIGGRSQRVLVLTEGLIMYLTPEDVSGLGRDLATIPSFQYWLTDLISPGLLKLIDKSWGDALRAGNAQMRFAPDQGPAWFAPLGWRTVECRSAFVEAGKLKRLPWLYHLFSLLPGAEPYNAKRPWSGVCLLSRSEKSP